MSKPTKEQLLDGYNALREASVDPVAILKAMEADGLSPSTASALSGKAAARHRLDLLKADPTWFAKVMAGDADATVEYERLNRDLAG